MERPKIVSLKDPAFSLPEAPKPDQPELPPEGSTRNLTPIPVPPEPATPKPLELPAPSRLSEPQVPVSSVSSTSSLSEIKPPEPVQPPQPSPLPPSQPPRPVAPTQPSVPPVSSRPAPSTVVLPEPSRAPAGAPPWVERQPAARPEEKDDDLGRELTGPRVVSVKREDPSRIQHDFAEQAARDILPPSVGPQTPLTVDQERTKAKELAQKIHEDNQNQGLFGRIKRALGFR